MASEKILEDSLSKIVLYKQMTPWGMASLGPRGLIGRIYVGDTKHSYILNI